MMTKAIWLLDLDGVVNAVPARISDPPPTCWPEDQWIRAEVKNSHSDTAWPILAATPVLDFITNIHTLGLAEIRWHTTWQEEANLVSDAVGLPHFEVEHAPEYQGWTRGGARWWKVPAVKRVSLRNRGFVVWTDDDAAFPTLQKQDRLSLRNEGVLIVAPSGAKGLTQSNLDKIQYYLQLDLDAASKEAATA